MSLTLIDLTPLDTLFFRDNRPFEAGTETFAESTFPSPLAIYGAIGNHVLTRNDTQIDQFQSGLVEDPTLGTYDCDLTTNCRVKIKGIFLKLKDMVLVPPPVNLFLQKKINRHWFAVPTNTRPESFLTDMDGSFIPSLRPLML
ncbi:MAG: type III-B CRISPR module-associated Cmr3 family protein, partial [Dehalococcoidia bacterium]